MSKEHNGLPHGRKETRLDPMMGELVKLRWPIEDAASRMALEAAIREDPYAIQELEEQERVRAEELANATVAGAAVSAAVETVPEAIPEQTLYNPEEALIDLTAPPEYKSEYYDQLASSEVEAPVDIVSLGSQEDYDLAAK